MKKLLSVLLVALLSLALFACGKKEEDKKVSEENKDAKPKIAYITGNLGDKSFSDSGEEGMNILRKEGYEVKTIETNNKAEKFNDYIIDAIEQGAKYIFASNTYFEACKKASLEYKDVKFIIFDDSKTSEELGDNMAAILYAQNEGSYLIGYLSAAMTKTGNVAVNVGMDNPIIADFVTGFVHGVLDYNAANNKNVKVVKAAVGSWSDPAKMKSLCLDQARNNNVDVFFQVAGGSGDGLFEACKETNTLAIGVDSDQRKMYLASQNPEKAEVILTSMLKEVGNSFVAIMHKIEKGENVWSKTNTLSLADDAVGYVADDFYKANVPSEVQEQLASVVEKIKKGEIKVKSYFDFANEDEYTNYLAQVQK